MCTYRPLFPRLPERTRLLRLLATHQALANGFFAESTLLGVAVTSSIDLCHPKRAGHLVAQLGAQRLSNHRWIVGVRFGYGVNSRGLIVNCDLDTANVHVPRFTEVVAARAEEMEIYTDSSFHRKEGDLRMAVCERGSRNQRMIVETVLRLLCEVSHSKRMRHRVWEHLTVRIRFLGAVFNLLVQWEGRETAGGRLRLSIAEFNF